MLSDLSDLKKSHAYNENQRVEKEGAFVNRQILKCGPLHNRLHQLYNKLTEFYGVLLPGGSDADTQHKWLDFPKFDPAKACCFPRRSKGDECKCTDQFNELWIPNIEPFRPCNEECVDRLRTEAEEAKLKADAKAAELKKREEGLELSVSGSKGVTRDEGELDEPETDKSRQPNPMCQSNQ